MLGLGHEGLAGYFLAECVPMTYQGVWSTAHGNWVVAPTDNAYFEHSREPACKTCWAWTSIQSTVVNTSCCQIC